LSFDPFRRMPPSAQSALPWVVWATAVVAIILLSDRLGSTPVGPGAAHIQPLHLASMEDSYVRVLPVPVGAWVEAGTVVAELSSSALDNALADAKQTVELEQARLTAATIRLRGSGVKELARMMRDSEQADVQARTSEASLARQQGELQARKAQLADQEALVKSGAAVARTRDELRLLVAEAEQAAAEADSLVKTAATAAQRSKQRSEQLRASVDVDGSLAPFVVSLSMAKRRVDELTASVAALTLRAPRRMQVLALPVAAGSFAKAGTVVVSMVDASTNQFTMWLGESECLGVTEGDVVELTPHEDTNMRTGKVTAIGAAVVPLPAEFRLSPERITPSRAIMVVVDGDPLRPGQRFEARVRTKP
jgi:multidrug resistance efflux pump